MKYLALAVVIAALSACNTVRGAGEDVAATGNAVSNAAEDVEAEIEEETSPPIKTY